MEILQGFGMLLKAPFRLFSRVSISAIIKHTKLYGKVAIGSKTRVYNSKVGEMTYIGRNSVVNNAEIGKFCSIATGVTINPGEHILSNVSTSPVFEATNILKVNYCDSREKQIVKQTKIGNDVLISVNCYIAQGIVIGDGVVIGAHSVVTKDVEPYCIVAGNPAKVIRKRFSEEQIARLLEIKWWDSTLKNIKEKGQLFKNIDEFLNNW